MNYQDLQSEENEHLSIEDEKIRQMCGGLKRVDAPPNFDFQLKARITAHQPSSAKSPIFAFLRYAAPLGLAIVFLGAVVSNNFYSVDNTAVPSLAGTFTETPRLNQTSPIENQASLPFIAKTNGPNADFESETAKTENSNSNQTLLFSMKDKDAVNKVFDDPKNNRRVETNSNSLDSASTQPRVFTERTPNTNKSVEMANGFNNPTSFSVKKILSFIGIEANFSGSGWKVESVRQSSVAERSGIKPNDFIEAIDNNRISIETIQTNSISVKKMTVVRDGQRFEIVLK